MRSLRWLTTALLHTLGVGCGQTEDDKQPELGPPAVGQERLVELRFLRFDVSNFEQVMTRQEILDLPAETRDRMWLSDLDLTNGPTTPRLLDNALEAVRK